MESDTDRRREWETLSRPLQLECCGGEQYAFVASGDQPDDGRVIVVRQHQMWCSCAY